MKTLFVSYRVTDLDRSLGFYTALGYIELGRVEIGDGARLVILKFPDEPAASLELVHRPGDGPIDVGSGFDHLAIQVETLATTLETLTERRPGARTPPVPGRPARPEDVMAHGPGRVPDRVGGVAVRTSRRHHRSRLRLRQPRSVE